MIQFVVVGVVVLLTVFFLNVKSKMSFWKRRGVPEDPGFFPFGSQSFWNVLQRKIHFFQLPDAAYINFPGHPLVGAYDVFGKPSVVVRDLDLVKNILVKDFDKFIEKKPLSGDWASPHTKNNKYFMKMLVSLRTTDWKHARTTFTPIFRDEQKLASMAQLIHKVADECNSYLENSCGEMIEGKELMKNFALDVIISVGFGHEINSFQNQNNTFKHHADLFGGNKPTAKGKMATLLFLLSPQLQQWLDLPVINKDAADFFANLAGESMVQRKKDGTHRNDFIDNALEIVERESKEKSGVDALWTEEEVKDIVISNSMVLLLAGFDPVASTAAVFLYYLAKSQDVQEKLHQEISAAINERDDGKLGYATIMKMSYLDMNFQETARLHPPMPLVRVAKDDYKVPDTDVVIPKDIYVRIPIAAIARDAKYYPNPNQFNPENFNEENKGKRHPYASVYFGCGPRNCIADRFATMEVKIMITRIVSKFKILPCEKTVDQLVLDPKSKTFQPIGGIWFTLLKRKS